MARLNMFSPRFRHIWQLSNEALLRGDYPRALWIMKIIGNHGDWDVGRVAEGQARFICEVQAAAGKFPNTVSMSNLDLDRFPWPDQDPEDVSVENEVGFLPQHLLEKGPFRLDPAAKTLHIQGRLVRLTQREYSLLRVLMTNEPGMVPRYFLAEILWDAHSPTRQANVNKTVERLRSKLGPKNGRHLVTQRGVGYGFISELS